MSLREHVAYESKEAQEEKRELETLLREKQLGDSVEVKVTPDDGGGQPVLLFKPWQARGGKDELRSAIEKCTVGVVGSLISACRQNGTLGSL